MKKHFLLIAAAVFVVGGFASNSSSSHQTEQYDLQKKEVATLPTFVITAVPAMANYTPVEVIRPKTELFVVKHEMEKMPAIVAAVIPVAHGPPNS